ncbi:MAG: hypothetical protein EA378_07215 [Phycisphaerales bacterium]|nr:MAG: hypothetical protein EA378_07215 [Phycisphaerales bacterium]
MSSFTKDALKDALRAVTAPGAEGGLIEAQGVEWAAACDGHASVRLHLPQCTGEDQYRSVSDKAAEAIAKKAQNLGQPLESLLIEFVDHAGTVLFTAKAGRPDAESKDAAPAEPKPAPSAAASPGHRPIPGLRDRTPLPQAPKPPASTPAARAPTPQASSSGLPGVKHAIAVGAGKGGVGKSAVAVNLAVGLARQGHAVGLLDGDIYGPSAPTMLALDAMEQVVHDGQLQPYLVHGIKAITIGKLVDPEKPLIWRGPMAHGAFKQLTEQTHWGELDYLIIDLPPGTGDVPLTMAQTLKLTGAVIVCTPQKVAQDDAVRAARMFQQLGVEILGVVENMSYFVADDIDPPRTYDIFGRGGAQKMAQRLGLPFLAEIPITPALRQNSDQGDPTANFEGAAPLRQALETMVQNLENQVALASLRQGTTRPTLTIS